VSNDARQSRGTLPVPARILTTVVTVCGVGAVLYSVAAILASDLPKEWVLFAFLTIASGFLTVKIPSIDTRFCLAEAFAFASVLLFGPEVGALTLALDGLRVSHHWKMNAKQTAFNFANLGLSMWLSGRLFFLSSGASPLYTRGATPATIVFHLALMTAAYFALNSGLTAAAVALTRRQAVAAIWRQHYWPLLPSYLAGGSVSLLLVLAFREVHFTAIALILPLLLICYLTLKSSVGRLEDARKHVEKLNRLLFSTVETLATAIDAKDEVTHDHVRRVQQGALALARELGVSDEPSLKAIEAGALLHDTGKIAVPEHILNKPGRLTPSEFEKMKRHAPIGAQILSSIEFPYPVVPIVRHHHENWDGTGYPDGLKGEDIPIGARILSVVDCFDALTSDRPYRGRMTDAKALQIIVERRGTMYDPAIVDVFVGAYTRIMPPAASAPHPVVQAVGEARSQDRVEERAEAATAAGHAIPDGLLAITSLSRTLGGDARLSDVGSLLWLLSRHIVSCEAMAVFMVEENADHVVARYSAGSEAATLRGVSRPMGSGIAGWVASTRKPAVNADPQLDFGPAIAAAARPLRSCLALPLVDRDAVVAVLAFYAEATDAFSDDHLRLLDLLAPKLARSLAGAAAGEEQSPKDAIDMSRSATLVYRNGPQPASRYH
jgi:putative nucleotidyltransferase with HDIG domain